MNKPQFTPGPWYVNPRGFVVQSTGDIVTRLECSNNKESDGCIIAAAPELYAALARLFQEVGFLVDDGKLPKSALAHPSMSAARAALAKATATQ